MATPVFAFASRRSQVVFLPATVDHPTFGSATTTCAPGQHVLFGGFENGTTGMRRTADNRWTVDSWNEGIAGPAIIGGKEGSPVAVSSFAYCGRGPVPSKATSTVDIRYRSRPYGAYGSATARCPAGTVVVGGGYATSPNSIVVVTGLERVAADLWRVSVWMARGTTHTALTSIAYCGSGPAPRLVAQTVTSFLHRGYLGLARATCKAGAHLVFGGAVLKRTGDESLQTLRVPANAKNTWAVTAFGGLGRGKLTALAYCR